MDSHLGEQHPEESSSLTKQPEFLELSDIIWNKLTGERKRRFDEMMRLGTIAETALQDIEA